MYAITLKIGGTKKEFSKDFINVEDNLLAVEHQVRQTALFENEKDVVNPKKHRQVNEAYLQMFVDMYAGQFTVTDLKQANVEVLEVLNNLYIDALGGKKEDEEGGAKKE
ncbi:phage tail assembly chaperone G [Streptococcus pluranimalium]|uniref:phage tail assembly chaperone G n=1 Tax=Streptococcus pluranimalium TaxID=82348 RepID=UPI003F674484